MESEEEKPGQHEGLHSDEITSRGWGSEGTGRGQHDHLPSVGPLPFHSVSVAADTRVSHSHE